MGPPFARAYAGREKTLSPLTKPVGGLPLCRTSNSTTGKATSPNAALCCRIAVVGSQTLFIVGIMIFIAAVAYLSWLSKSKRRAMMADWAAARGFDFDPANNRMFSSRHPFFGCLNRGDSRYAYNVCTGSWEGLDCTVFDYHYGTGSGKSRQEHYFSGVIMPSKVPLKPLFIRPENFFDHIAEFVGFDDINFESNEFSRKFFVKSPDRKWAYDVITQDTMQFLLDSPIFYLQFGPTEVIAYREGLFQPADIEAAADLIKGLFDRLPDYVLKQQMGDRAEPINRNQWGEI